MPFKPKLKFTKLYFPGLISLTCLPLLLVTNMLYGGWFDRLHIIEVDYFSKGEISGLQKEGMFNLDTSLLKKNADYLFSVERGNSDEVIKKIYSASFKLSSNKDSDLLLKVVFTKKTSYKDYVSIVDACHHLDSNLSVMCTGNDLFIWKFKPHKYVITTIKPILMDCERPLQQPTFIVMLMAEIKNLIKLRLISLSLLLLITMYILHFTGKGRLHIPIYRKLKTKH